jgi:superfamily II DNA or RNA helicase
VEKRLQVPSITLITLLITVLILKASAKEPTEKLELTIALCHRNELACQAYERIRKVMVFR